MRSVETTGVRKPFLRKALRLSRLTDLRPQSLQKIVLHQPIVGDMLYGRLQKLF